MSATAEAAEPRTDLVLLNPGPANTSERVRRALGRGDMCHREPEFARLLGSIREGLVETLVSPDSHEAVVISGSGTAAVEMALSSSVRAGRAALVLNNGSYGERISRMCTAQGLKSYEVTEDWDRPIASARVAEALAAHPDIDAVVGVMHETTSGLLNPMEEIGAVVAESDAVLVVDAISATGHEEPGLPQIRADLVCGTANKGLHGLPGAAFVLVGRGKGSSRVQEAPARSLYLDLAGHLRAQRAGDVLHTPAVQVYQSFDEAIKEFREQGGYRARVADYRARSALLRAGFARLGLEVLVAQPHRSNSVTAVRLPAGMTYDRLHDALKKRGFVIYAAQGRLSGDYFRVSNMGELSLRTLSRFVSELEGVLSPW
ncbi:pyridoxal-phosphate-dependent aminotransferase family protein [Saccharothrix luteola]|uniref:pyridoxal-phosphate-dependent aminotransferase family protein n=1 Tax=Saccharothrix luteola TaxID=2893018 RepID=UPI001E55FB8F|nr:aminotransferase class V-fold PLP-dependent enzyme [Saccharothrix luteola]MCC8251542.1 aminotransferase class V-fold PLP-dependent enzyme [Saccharothrix luteola]